MVLSKMILRGFRSFLNLWNDHTEAPWPRIVLCQTPFPLDAFRRYLKYKHIPYHVTENCTLSPPWLVTSSNSIVPILNGLTYSLSPRDVVGHDKGWIFIPRPKGFKYNEPFPIDGVICDALIPFKQEELQECYQLLRRFFDLHSEFSDYSLYECFGDDLPLALEWISQGQLFVQQNPLMGIWATWSRRRYDLLWVYLRAASEQGISVLAVWGYLTHLAFQVLRAYESGSWNDIPFPIRVKIEGEKNSLFSALKHFLYCSSFLEKDLKQSSLPYETLFFYLVWSFYGSTRT